MNNGDFNVTLATVCKLLQAEGMIEASNVIRNHHARMEKTGYDNWNGGTEIWEVFFELPATEYVRLGQRRSHIEEQITARLKTVLETETQDWYSAKIIPAKENSPNWREEHSEIAKPIRHNIIDGIQLERTIWYGSLDEVEFLSRLYDLETLPSFDSRFDNAAGDIWQHCINNDDWQMNWIFSDERFQLIEGQADVFLRFLCEMVHPVIRPDKDEALKLVSHFNNQLIPSGWEIFEEELIAGRPRFFYRLISHHEQNFSRAKSVADSLDAGWMAKEIERLENATDSDPALAIGTAKELIETCCKTILKNQRVAFTKNDDLGNLTKKLTKELLLVPEGISDDAKGAKNIRLILRNLTQLSNNLAQLRGLYGTGHGRDGQFRGLQPRHARLAVTSAIAFIDFVTETYRQRQISNTVIK